MLQVLRPRLVAHGHVLLCRSKGIGSGCVRRGRRRLSTTSEPSKPAGSANTDEEPGWPLKYKLAGGALLGSIIPWMFSYAVANDPGSRRLVAKMSPALVQYYRNRQKGGYFFDEDPKRIEYLAHAPEWSDQPVTMEVRTGSGETRRLQDVDARTPFSSVGGMVHAGGGGGGAGKGGRAGWLTDFEVLDDVGAGDGEGYGAQGSSPSWDTASSGGRSGGGSSSSSGYQDDGGGNSYSDAIRRAVGACNIRSWWDIAAMEQEQARQPAPPAAAATASAAASPPSGAARAGSSSAGGVASASSGLTMGAARPSPVKKMSEAEQAVEMIEHLERMVESLEQDKLTGARSVDDVEEEVRDIRKQQRELRRTHPGRRKFLGLF